jgi:predicted transcriptional regulator
VERTTIYLPEELQRSLREVARRTGRPQAQLIREALAAYLETQPQPLMQSIGLGADDELTGRDSEAWLDEAWGRR